MPDEAPESPTVSECNSSFYYYNPYEKRTVKVPLTNFDAFISLLKCVIGTGILAMPLAIRYSGIMPGVVLSTVLMILLTYCIHLLISGMTECCRRARVPQVSMPEAVKIAYQLGPECLHSLADAAGAFTSFVLVLGQLGLCCVYIVFVSKNFKEIGDYHFQNYNERYYVLAVCLFLLPFFMIRKLKYLVPLNLASNILLYLGFLCIMYYLFRELPDLQTREIFNPPTDCIIFFGIAAFSLTAVGSMLVVEANMAHPQSYLGYCGVLNLAVLFILFSNLFFGIMGYWRFGDQVKASITLNIPQNEILSQFIKISIASGIFLSYPLNGFVVIAIVFSNYGVKEDNLILEILVRLVFLAATGIIAVIVPNLAALTELEGSFSLCNLNLLCPALIDIFINYDTGYGRLRWMLIRDIIIILIGIIFGIVGCTVAIKQLIDDFGGTIQSLQS